MGSAVPANHAPRDGAPCYARNPGAISVWKGSAERVAKETRHTVPIAFIIFFDEMHGECERGPRS